MTFKLPAPGLYLGSLFLAIPVAGLLYWILQQQHLTQNGLIALGVGLFIGHLAGVCSRPAAAAQGSDPAAHSPSPAGKTLSLYVGNLAYRAQRDELEALFAQYGPVSAVRIMTDRATRRPRGYAFVEMDASGARAALSALDNTQFCGRTLRVSEARQKKGE